MIITIITQFIALLEAERARCVFALLFPFSYANTQMYQSSVPVKHIKITFSETRG